MMKRRVRLLVLTTSCLVSPLCGEARADDFDIDGAAAPSPSETPAKPKGVTVNEFSVGYGGVSGDSALFGRYDGLNKAGGFTTGTFRLQYRSVEDPHDTHYAVLEGDGLDFTSHALAPSASLSMKTGEQGLWGASFSYDGVPYSQSNNYQTLFDSSGNLQNGLTPRSVSTTASAATGSALVNSHLATIGVGTRRDRFEGKTSYSGLEDWILSSKVEHEHKQGTKINSMLFMANSSFASFPEPEDYDTDRVTLSGAYTTQKFQAELSYVFSSFRNNMSEYDVMSPFSGTVHGTYTRSEYSLAPSNMEHQLKGMFGYNLTERTHLAVNTRYGLQLQDAAYTARYYDAANAATPGVSANSFDGTIQNMYANAVLTSRPWADWNFKASYSVDDRDNLSDSYRTRSYRADGTQTFQTTTSAPYSFLFQKANLEAGYRAAKSTKITLDYTFDDRQRTYSVTGRNQENTLGAQVRTTFTPELTNSIGVSHGIRAATDYSGNGGWLAMARSVTGESRLSQYNYAARVRDEVKDNLTWGRGSDWSLGGTLRYTMDNYPTTYFGVTGNRMMSVGPDVNFTIMPGLTGNLFYNYEMNFTNMMEWNSTSTVNGTAWSLGNRDEVHTIGASTQWKPTDRLTFSAENTLSFGNTAFDEASWSYGTSTGAANTAVSLPTARSITNILKLSGEYEMEDNLYLGLTGIWQRYLNDDYLTTELASSTTNQTATAVVSNDGNGSYSIKALIATLRMSW
ncbi:MAG TPA: MtrB/PioB family decaheme-associated outer membrane protein [Candidatus Sulfotelmatobacter sp.]|nr:MtrB/PioB family decaheme-associated outer membrane protein [Candidatus Sulfotelmatobacter sp.]